MADSGAPQPAPRTTLDDHSVHMAEIGMQIRDLHDRALSLFLADPESMDALRTIFDQARSSIQTTVDSLHPYVCPAGTVRCARGCCFPTRTPDPDDDDPKG